MKTCKIFLSPVLISVLVLSFSHCGIYSFQGAATNARTISIAEFFNNTELAPPTIGQVFTNRLKDYMIQNTSLSVVAENGELQLEGIITGYQLTQVAPVAGANPARGDLAASTRFTITVKVTYTNTLDPSMSFKDRSFSFFRDFSNDISFADVEESLTRQIMDQLILDIFNATVANW
ncbi:MAG: LPS assembly lipoprotein LptE [Cyclobacteriaceae bacterium]|nr:LPS assembly lipoprotein LptE [Cyclobacteriaceae bacterium]MCX7637946.1 LPS assembly lipoprotein LptE [Cyclobacteriaceae bacterium]MDW8332170.1 LptE family protein [Cyclobacteriaceae bacterium]